MGLRIKRGMTARILGAPDAHVMKVWDVFPGETLNKIEGQFYAMTRGNGISLNDVFDLEVYLMYFPDRIWHNAPGQGETWASQVNEATSVSELDARWAKLLLDYEQDSTAFFDQPALNNTTEGDAQQVESSDDTTDVSTAGNAIAAGKRYMGPLGVTRLASIETMLEPWAATGNNVGLYRFAMPISRSINISDPGVVVMGTRRNEYGNASGGSMDTLAIARSGRIEALNRLRGGDMSTIREALMQGGTDWANECAEILFGREIIIDGGTDPNLVGDVSGSNGQYNAALYWSAVFDTPYSVTV